MLRKTQRNFLANPISWKEKNKYHMIVGDGNPFQYSCLENPMDREAWQTMVHGVTESDTTETTRHAHTTYMWNLKYGTNDPLYIQKQTHRRGVVVAKGEGGGGGIDWELGISRYQLLHVEWINIKHPTV